MNESHELSCACSHDRALHDRHGCAAFLGSFAATAHIKRYCPCDRPAGIALSLGHGRALHPATVVAEVRLRERRGAAIGVCDVPPALEVGVSAASVLTAIKTRLAAVIPPPHDDGAQVLRIVHEAGRESRVRVELLR